MALKDMISVYSPQKTITFHRNSTSFTSNFEPNASIAGRNNTTSGQEVIKINKPGLNNLTSNITPIFVGSGLAKK